MTPNQSNHPVIKMSHGRAFIWKTQATDEDFMRQLSDLASIYAGKKREEGYKLTGKYEDPDYLLIFKHYKTWVSENG